MSDLKGHALRMLNEPNYGLTGAVYDFLAEQPKDCGCVVHEGCHDWYFQLETRRRNLDLLITGGQWSGPQFCRQEADRLSDLLRILKRRGFGL